MAAFIAFDLGFEAFVKAFFTKFVGTVEFIERWRGVFTVETFRGGGKERTFFFGGHCF